MLFTGKDVILALFGWNFQPIRIENFTVHFFSQYVLDSYSCVQIFSEKEFFFSGYLGSRFSADFSLLVFLMFHRNEIAFFDCFCSCRQLEK